MRYAVEESGGDLFILEFVGYLLKVLLLTIKETMIFSCVFESFCKRKCVLHKRSKHNFRHV